MTTPNELRSDVLGALVSEHKRNARRNLSFVVLLAAGGLVALLAGPLMRSRGVGGGLCVSGFGLLILVLAAWSAYVARRDRDLSVRVCEKGMVEQRGGSGRLILWDKVAHVNHTVMETRRAGATVRTTHLCTLQLKNDGRVQYSDATLEDVGSLCDAVQVQSLAPMLAAARSRLAAGETVSFGKVDATSEGLNTGTETLTWSRLHDVSVDNGNVVALVDGVWRNIGPAGRINNVHVLRALAAQTRANEPPG